MPGLVVAVSRGERTVYAKGFGLADIENNVRAHPLTVMRIASISKPLSTLLAACLVERGLLDIDAPLETYLAASSGASDDDNGGGESLVPFRLADGRVATITCRQLMSHTAGIRHYGKEKDNTKTKTKKAESSTDTVYEEFYETRRFESTRQALDIFARDPLRFEPGTDFLYTTHGYTLLAHVLEQACRKGSKGESKVAFATLYADLFRSLGMHGTHLDEARPLIAHRAKYYMRSEAGRHVNVPYVDLSSKWAGGGVLSNVLDLLKLGNFMLTCYHRQSDRHDGRPAAAVLPFVSSRTVRHLLWSPQTLNVKSAISPSSSSTLDKLLNGNDRMRTKIAYGLGWFLCLDETSGALKYVVSGERRRMNPFMFNSVVFSI